MEEVDATEEDGNNMENTKEKETERLEGESMVDYLYRKYKLTSWEERHKEDIAMFNALRRHR